MITAFDVLEPFRYEFFARGMVAAVIAGVLCGLAGVFVVLRSMSYVGHGLSHAAFGGAAIAASAGSSYFLGAGLWAGLVAVVIWLLSRRPEVGADTAIGVVTSASLAIGLVVRARAGGGGQPLEAVLFGNVLGVAATDLAVLAGVAGVVVAWLVGNRRTLVFATFDREAAQVAGTRVDALELLLLLSLAATVIVCARVVGALLISALLVLPAAAARLLSDSSARLLRLAPVIGAACGAIGMYVSWWAGVSSGAAITLVATGVLAIAYALSDAARRRAIGRADRHAVLD